LNHAGRLRIFPVAGGAVPALEQEGTRVVVVTNQSVVARKHSSNAAEWIPEQTR